MIVASMDSRNVRRRLLYLSPEGITPDVCIQMHSSIVLVFGKGIGQRKAAGLTSRFRDSGGHIYTPLWAVGVV